MIQPAVVPSAIERALSADLHGHPGLPSGKGLVLYMAPDSCAAVFYDRLFDHTEAKERPELWDARKSTPRSSGNAPLWDRSLIEAIGRSGTVLELGGGVNQIIAVDDDESAAREKPLCDIFENYVPLDISHSSIRAYAAKYGRFGIVCDATRLPFRDESLDCVCTQTFLEHPPDPDAVMREITRVVRPGGYIVLDDAWFCRWWARYGIVGLKRFGSMSLRERMIAVCAAVTELPFVRIPPIVMRRCLREFLVSVTAEHRLRGRRLRPNYDLMLGCDEDAATAIDPLDVIRYCEARGFRLRVPLTRWQRLLCRNKPVVMVRNANGRS